MESVLIYKKFVKSWCRLGYSAEYCKLDQFQKIREINVCHLYQGLNQKTKTYVPYLTNLHIFVLFESMGIFDHR